jgi:aspartate/glutamate racemase
MRDKINEYFNPDIKEIAYVGIPISSKMYIHFFSEKLFKENKPISDVIYEDSFVINKINKASYDVCQNKIACENEDYLKKFINKIKTVAQQRTVDKNK